MALPVQVRALLEYWRIGVLVKMKARIQFELVLSLLHYSTTPSLQTTGARGKEYGNPLRWQWKAGYFGSGFFTSFPSAAVRSPCSRCSPL